MQLRSSKNVKMNDEFTRLTKIQKSPYYRGLSLWDKLPKELQLVDSRMVFKDEDEDKLMMLPKSHVLL